MSRSILLEVLTSSYREHPPLATGNSIRVKLQETSDINNKFKTKKVGYSKYKTPMS